MDLFRQAFLKNPKLEVRRTKSIEKLKELRQKLAEYSDLKQETCIYCAGSLGRGEIGELSDLDLFILSLGNKACHLDDLEVLAQCIYVNRELGYGPFSNDGQYLKVYKLEKMCGVLGSPHDDSENLLLLECFSCWKVDAPQTKSYIPRR